MLAIDLDATFGVHGSSSLQRFVVVKIDRRSFNRMQPLPSAIRP